LLEAATQLIAERGTTAVGFGEIAKAAEVSHGLPSYLFGTKSGLLCALVERFRRQIHEGLTLVVADATGLGALERALRTSLGILRDPWAEARALNVLLGEALGPDAALRETVNSYHAELRAMIAGWLREGIDAGEIRPDVSVDEQATLWIAVVRGVSYHAIADPSAFDADTVADELWASAQRLLQA
jgi:AcrR family transcriptional regulator